MTRWKSALLALAGIGLLSISVVSCVVPVPGSNPSGDGRKAFVVSGNVEDLRPGGTRPMVLTVRNPNSVAIRVTSITVSAGGAGGGCTAASLTLPHWTGSLQVPKRGTAAVTVDVALKPTAPDACRGAQWPLTYGGAAVKA
jgi:hypothetical protein